MELNTVQVIKSFENRFAAQHIQRPLRVERYDAGDLITYEVALIAPSGKQETIQVSLLIERFVGGGFAGQVYKIKVLSIGSENSPFHVGGTYALKIFIPPSRGALLFRNLLYGIGFQGPFQIQCNPDAARAGALWQKFIRRAAALHFKDEYAVNDVHGILIDHTLGSCGEISNWVEGRTWRLEVDNYVDILTRWEKGEAIEDDALGSPEYRAKKKFLQDLVSLLHEMGAHEFARQYEWSTWKSQPNALKRLESDDEPDCGLTAVDFRAGLTLLPFLPMSPGDIKLILQGIKQGSLVQFDRGKVNTLEAYVKNHQADFADISPLLEELKTCENIYRNSIPDITHNHFRLLYDRNLYSTMAHSAITGWEVRNLIDQTAKEKLLTNKLFFAFFLFIGLIPFIGPIIRRILGRQDYRSHYARLIYDIPYLKRTLLAVRIENIIRWIRAGRITEEKSEKIYTSFLHYSYHLFLSFFSAQIHRFFSDRPYFIETLYSVMIKPLRLYFNAALREEWLKSMVEEGEQMQLVSKEDVRKILSQIQEPFIHKYLKSLAVHVIMSPATRVISVGIAILYLVNHPEISAWEAFAIAAGIIAFFQIIPISPGSLARGLYVLFVVIKERNLKDYSIALTLSFFKYIGYFSFPIQMTYRYPTLARCMVGFWTTKMVRAVPVFGEAGALLEHKIFTIFYNWPLTIRRKVWERRDRRETQKIRVWHTVPISIFFGILSGYGEYLYASITGFAPTFFYILPIILILGLLSGILINIGSGGASSLKRVSYAVIGGFGIGIINAAVPVFMADQITLAVALLSDVAWKSFILVIFSAMGAILMEFKV
ncbi:MAG: hypothetical protein HY867_05240 [Chloroflexi bacterium]|nr:hypothetical protein [Chloroflexota bacterium]